MENEAQVRHGERLIWVGLGLTLALLVLAFLLALLKVKARQEAAFPVYGAVAEFTLTNQLGAPVTASSLLGHVWIADIIFTRCAGPCLKMSRQMKELQDELAPESSARLISLTTDPEYDTPAVLKAYAQRFGADANRWQFLTGTKEQIAKVAADSLKLTAVEKSPETRESAEDLFIHSTIFVVVDKQGRLRGIYETSGEGVDPVKMKNEILRGVRWLERER